MLGNAMRICEAQCGFIYRMEASAMRVMAEIGVPPAFAEYRRNHQHTGGATTPVDLMRATKKPAHVHDARESDAYRTGNPNAVAGVDLGGARTVLYVPMLKEGEIVGVINVYRQEVRPFADKRSRSSRILPRRPSSPSRIPGCSASCAISPAADCVRQCIQGDQ